MEKLFLGVLVLVLFNCTYIQAQDHLYVYKISGSPIMVEDNITTRLTKGSKISLNASLNLNTNSSLVLVNKKGELFELKNGSVYRSSDLTSIQPIRITSSINEKYFAYVWRNFVSKPKYRNNYGVVYREFNELNLLAPSINEKLYNSKIVFEWNQPTINNTKLLIKDLASNQILEYIVSGNSITIDVDNTTLKFGYKYGWTIIDTQDNAISDAKFFNFEIANQIEVAEFQLELEDVNTSIVPIDERDFAQFFSQSKYIFPMGSDKEDDLYESIPLKVTQTEATYRNINNSASLKRHTPTSRLQRYGTCVGWAVAYSARTTLEAQRNNWTDKEVIDENSFSPGYFYRTIAPDKGDCSGANTSYAVSYLKDYGALPSRYWNRTGDEYFCPQSPLESTLIEKAREYKIDEYARLFERSYDYDASKASKVKLSLDNDNPVVVSLNCPPSFHHVRNGRDLWVPTEDPSGDYGGHAVTVIGYDDNKYDGAFLIQNSWGYDYGDEGFVWVTYDDFNHFFYRALELVNLPKLEPEEPIFKGGLRFIDIDTNEALEFKLAEKFRNWNTVLNNGEHTYKATKSLKSGTRVRIMANNDQPAFVYILGTGSVNTSIANLFPGDNLGLSAALNYKNNEVALPNEDGAFVMDDTVGKDYMIMLFSRESLDINDIKKQLATKTGKFGAKLKSVLGDKLIPYKDITFNKNNIQFETLYKGDDNKVMALIIEFDHI